MTYEEAYKIVDEKYAAEVREQQDIIIETQKKWDDENYTLTDEDYDNFYQAQDKIIEIEGKIVEEAEKMAKGE